MIHGDSKLASLTVGLLALHIQCSLAPDRKLYPSISYQHLCSRVANFGFLMEAL